MSVSQLIAVITLVSALLVAGIQLGRSQQLLEDLKRRVDRLEQVDRYLHGNGSGFLKQP